MARRQQKLKPQDILFSIVLLLLAYVAPVVILLGWAVAEYRAKSTGSNPDDSLLLSDEISQVQSRIEELWQDGQARGLNMRQDNMFDARSSEGRELNSAIYAEQAALEDLQDQLEGLAAPLAQRDAMRGAAIAWVGAFVLLWSRQPDGAYFWMSVWASVAAIVVAACTYFIRKAAYESPPTASQNA